MDWGNYKKHFQYEEEINNFKKESVILDAETKYFGINKTYTIGEVG